MTLTTRFAPSPTGLLHLGHAYSAILAHDIARAHGGRFLLRIEDIDTTRARTAWTTQLMDDLRWLGLRWDAEPMAQSQRHKRYGAVLEGLWQLGLVYVCHCTRRDIQAALSAPQEGTAPIQGPDGLVYPGTCRALPRDTDAPLPAGAALRLDMRAALTHLGQDHFSFVETGTGHPVCHRIDAGFLRDNIGDIVLSRRDFFGSYHLSVVLDDADQAVTHIIRGQDLFDATAIHVLLQTLLDLPQPRYHHHRLIRDDQGKRLAKRDDARAISAYRDAGETPVSLRTLLDLQSDSAELMGAINSVSASPVTDV